MRGNESNTRKQLIGKLAKFHQLLAELETAETERKRVEEALTTVKNQVEIRVKGRTTELEKSNESLRREIAEHERTEQRLKVSEEELALIFQTTSEAVRLIDTDFNVIKSNAAMAALSRLDPEASTGRKCFDTFKGPSCHTKHCQLRRVMQTKTRLTTQEVKERSDGTKGSCIITASPIFDKYGTLIGILEDIRDITELKVAAEQQRALSHRLVKAQEEERRTIARELHDQIGQSLSVLNILLETATDSPSRKAKHSLEEARILVSELASSVRTIALDLRPAMLDDLGLLPALLWFFDRYRNQANLHIDFKHTGLQDPFEPDVNTTTYRVVQEALTNVVRHAGVNQVTVSARADGHTLLLNIADKGKGFDVESLAIDRSTGLSGMRERVQLLSGKLTVESIPGVGTTVTAEIPLSPRVTKRVGREARL